MTPATDRAAFDLLGDLPTGTTVLEASAGTGKTYAIVGLAVRYVAELGVDPERLLLVTFSRAATKELRERTRDRFAAVAAGLADPAASSDGLVAFLADADPDTVTLRRQRLLQALSNFDAATIATTHSFCQRMLDGIGIAGERDPDTELVEEATGLIAEAVSDLYLSRFGRDPDPTLTPEEARKAARAAIFDPQAVLAPANADGTAAGDAVAFAQSVRDEVRRRKRAAGIRDFDDLPALLHGVLTDDEHGEDARRRVRERYDVVLVDEFQDTDPLQWGILKAAFHGHATLILVGDPKQAIYAFRGAEVYAYLDAVTESRTLELTTNWRSDKPLLDALAHVQGGAALGHPDIVVHPVAAENDGSRVTGVPPIRLRYLTRAGAGPLGKSGYPAIAPLRARVADDVAADIVRLVSGEATIDLGSPSAGGRGIVPGDVAVLVRTNRQITLVHDALDRAGIPAVTVGGLSVFVTPAARDWLWVLQALEQPHRSDRVRPAALTSLLGKTATDLDAGGDELVAQIGGGIRDLGRVFATAGFAAMVERLAAWSTLESRLLARVGGERRLTDLRHIAQLLGEVAVAQGLGLTALTRWLTDRMREPNVGTADRSRRLDSDAAAVQIATVHATKGLEYPIVYVPFGWDAAKNPTPDKLLLHDDEHRRILDVGGPDGPGYRERRARHDEEEAGEELRLLYVALTRAKCALVLWWAPSTSTASAPLHRMLLARVPGALEVPRSLPVPADPQVAQLFTRWADGVPGVDVEAVAPDPIEVGSWNPPHESIDELEAATFHRVLDDEWRRTSYTAITAAAHALAPVASETEEPALDDEPEEPPLTASGADTGDGHLPSPMNGMPAGAAFGTLVHAVLEYVDTAADDLTAEVLQRCREEVTSGFADVDPDALAASLMPVLATPLGESHTLASIAPSDRLPELDFEFPLDHDARGSARGWAGDDAAAEVTLDATVALLRRHLPADDVLASYADDLAELGAVPLRGYLTGSIDAVLRLPGPRFVVVDYKTNRIVPGDVTTGHFTRDSMAAEMMRSHYPLQALLYSVALHRYLRWRLPGYDPEVHLGGVQYLFVRGMAGPDTPDGCGVFEWHPPAALITDLSDLLAGHTTHGGAR
ncbi:RecBCD enzyme subunit RecB [Rhodococcus sp. RD6.2]|uniref:UvrD-helicase domain-containing protein n=1 Tax=Rhodococcus sp. RD6.2 TaxID=260936 RepID=UPI00063B8E0C|nr:UvrD-helicase domain-containing protein [Rhodococcus sp. RD6.2]CRK50457.1 RecBCD enzyme subunit RecB [Rhodococcus sp. RD6.2]